MTVTAINGILSQQLPIAVVGGIGTTRTLSSILSDAFDMPQLGRARRVWLYLPPDYESNPERRYPVLYMHDGQNVFDEATSYAGEWGVDETLDAMHAAGELSVIVVAVDHGVERRFDEYSPWNNAQYGGGEGDEYVDFLVETLKPYVDAHYRTLPDRANARVNIGAAHPHSAEKPAERGVDCR